MPIYTVRSLRSLTLALVVSLSFFLTALPANASPNPQTLEEQVLQIIRQHPEVILESVDAYQKEQQEQIEREQRQRLKAILEDPQQVVGASPAQGDLDNRVLLLEFSDFQCPYCGFVHDTLKRFVENHGDEVILVYKHYPLESIHSEAMPAAAAAWAAHQQDKFWPYQDFLFTNQDQLGEEIYLQAAAVTGLDMAKFERDRNSKDAIDSIYADIALAEELGIAGTPFFAMNDKTFSGAVDEQFLEDKLSELTDPN